MLSIVALVWGLGVIPSVPRRFGCYSVCPASVRPYPQAHLVLHKTKAFQISIYVVKWDCYFEEIAIRK